MKYKFNEHYDPKTKKYKENIVGFEISSIKTSLIAGNSQEDNQQPRLIYLVRFNDYRKHNK